MKISLLTFLTALSTCITAQYKVVTHDSSKDITDLKSDVSGRLLYGTASGEVGIYDGRTFQSFAKLSSVNCIEAEEDGEIFIGTDEGLFKYPDLQNLSGAHLHVLDYDAESNIILARKGVFRKVGSQYIIDNRDRMPSYRSISKGKMLKDDNQKYLLLDSKLYRKERWWQLDGDSIIDVASGDGELIYALEDGIFQNAKNIYSGAIDSTAKILKTVKGRIFVTNNNFISELLDIDRMRPIYSINTAKINAIHQDHWDNIWVAGEGLLIKVITEPLQNIPKLNLVTINDKNATSSIKISTGEDLRIRYEGVQLTSPQTLRYQSRLEGKSYWSNYTSENSTLYPELPAGRYLYQVRATVNEIDFAYSEKLTVIVEDNIDSKIWLLLFIVAGLIFAAAWIANYRFNKFKSQHRQEKQKLKTENRLLALEQKSLQLQMNPHFIFNAINSIKGQIAKGDSREARQSLTSFAHLMRATLDISRKEKIAIEEEVKYIDRYLALEQWISQNRFSYNINVAPEVDELLKIPTMLIQPFVENALKHAFKGISKDCKIEVNINREGRRVVIEVLDNGVGLGKTKTNDSSVAISVVRDRLQLMFPNFEDDSLKIESPILEFGGTKVTIQFPVIGV